MILALASLTRMRGRPRSSRNRWLCSIRRRSFSSDMDGFGREDDMGGGRWWGEGGYTEEEDRSERLLCAATLLLGVALGVRKEKRVRISRGCTHLKGVEESLCVDQATGVRCTGDRGGSAVSKGWEGSSAY